MRPLLIRLLLKITSLSRWFIFIELRSDLGRLGHQPALDTDPSQARMRQARISSLNELFGIALRLLASLLSLN
jgi:hypothetical protein